MRGPIARVISFCIVACARQFGDRSRHYETEEAAAFRFLRRGPALAAGRRDALFSLDAEAGLFQVLGRFGRAELHGFDLFAALAHLVGGNADLAHVLAREVEVAL